MKNSRQIQPAIISAAAALCMLLVLSGEAAAKSDEDLTGLRGIRWGMTVTDAITLFGRSVLVQQTKTLLLGCFVQHAIPIQLLDEEWFIWLCEAPEKSVVAALNIETANRHTEHFNELLEAFVNAYGPAHSYWHTCHNVNWNKTVQYDWYFPKLKISLVDRDEPAKWVVMRYEPPSDKVEYGPGVCIEPPLDLRRDTTPG